MSDPKATVAAQAPATTPAPAAPATTTTTPATTATAETAKTETILTTPAAETKAATSTTEETKKLEAPKVPEKYDLKLPEGSILDAAHVEKTAALARERGLSQEQAQAVLDHEHQVVKDYSEAQQQALVERIEAWKQEAKTDKEYGGAKFAENAELARRALERFGGPLKDILNQTGLGNHPEVIRAFVKIGKAMANDKMVTPGAPNSAKPKSAAEILFPIEKINGEVAVES